MQNLVKYLAQKTRQVLGRVKSIELQGFNVAGGLENFFDSNNLATYKQSLYVYIGVSMIARAVAKIPFDYYRVINTAGEVEEVYDHEIIDIMDTPTSYLTRKEFIELSAMFYLLSGDVFWYFERAGATGKGKILAVHPLTPDKVEVVLNSDKDTVLAYHYRTTRGTAILAPENVVHTKSVDPTNIIRGFGIITPAKTRISTEADATAYQSNFFKNQGRPDVAVFVDQDLNQEQIDDGRTKWQEVYGRGNGGQAGFFGKNVKEVKMLNATPREMDYIQTQSFLRDDILATLHIPKAMITSDDVNLANSKTARINYMQEAVLPVLDAFKDAINNRLLPRIDDTLFVGYVDPTPEDRDIKLAENRGLKEAGIITANEARANYGYTEVDGADELVAARNPLAGLVTEGRAILKSRPRLRKLLDTQEKVERMIKSIVSNKTKFKGTEILQTREQQQAYAKAVNKSVDAKAAGIAVVVGKYYEGLAERVLASGNTEAGFSTTGFMDKTAEQIEIKNTIVPALERVLQKAGQEALDLIFVGQKSVGEEFKLTDALLARYADRYIFFANSITDTNFEIVKGTIMTGLAAGDSPDVIGRALRDMFTEMAVTRGKTIARTETAFAQSIATNEAYAQSNVVTGKRWITVGDLQVRASHAANEGAGVVGKGDAFPSGESYPAQHSINCRCVLAPAIGLQ